MSTQDKPKARLFTKAEYEERMVTAKATETRPETVTMESLCVGCWVSVEGHRFIGEATDVWVDEATGDIWCHYSPRPGIIVRPPPPPPPARPPFDPSRPGLYAVPY